MWIWLLLGLAALLVVWLGLELAFPYLGDDEVWNDDEPYTHGW